MNRNLRNNHIFRSILPREFKVNITEVSSDFSSLPTLVFKHEGNYFLIEIVDVYLHQQL